MVKQIVQINFHFAVSNDEFTEDATTAAEAFAKVPGLRWKIWLMSEDRHEGGGIYFFEDESSLQAFLKGELLASMKNNPIFKNLTVKQFSYLTDATKTTRGPV
jgi:hypothetical protein